MRAASSTTPSGREPSPSSRTLTRTWTRTSPSYLSAGINAEADFFLDDDTDATLSNTATFPVAPGIHTVTEALNGDYTTAIVCVDPTTNSSGANRVATINVAPGETVTCTYTNTLRPGNRHHHQER